MASVESRKLEGEGPSNAGALYVAWAGFLARAPRCERPNDHALIIHILQPCRESTGKLFLGGLSWDTNEG